MNLIYEEGVMFLESHLRGSGDVSRVYIEISQLIHLNTI